MSKFFAEKMWEAFAVQKFSHLSTKNFAVQKRLSFFKQKISVYLVLFWSLESISTTY